MLAVIEEPIPAGLRPTLTIRIGLVDHRFAAEAARFKPPQNTALREMLGGMFATLMAQAEALRLRHAAVFSVATPVCRLVSSLASGADLIAQLALPEGWQSEIILPMPATQFRLDYPEKASEAEPHDRALFDVELERLSARANTRILTMPDPGEDAIAGYVSAAQMILANCDVLVAAWDEAEQDRDDFEAFALRSVKTATAIESLLADLSLEQTHADFAGTTQVLQSCARVMSDDLEAWESLYGRKVLVLPA